MWMHCNFGLLLCFTLFASISCGKTDKKAEAPAKPASPAALSFVGTQKCAECHRQEYLLWTGSDHQLAMQPANAQTVLGDFNNRSFQYNGITSTFTHRDNKFFTRTDGPDGQMKEFEISYVFGLRPLQQYLIRFPDGRYQALSIAWDTRSNEDGGQRWFHMYQQEKIDHTDVLHWTGLYQNWNHMCADCHSTDLKKNFDAKTNQFSTSWFEINVGCESCHGPGSQHTDWAKLKLGNPENKALPATLKSRRSDWIIDPKTGNAYRKENILQTSSLIDNCAQCHSRRSQISNDYYPGKAFTDAYLPSLLYEPLYYVDGQLKDEVYEYGSFLQSKMFQQGVDCSNCHNSHSLKLTAPGNAVCAQCHLPAKYDASSHHFHKAGSTGSQCVECHMPKTFYMVVDGRRDHSMRNPRPDLSLKLGTPNACNTCHQDKSTKWAAQFAEKWYGLSKKPPHYGEIFYAARHYQAGADRELVKIAQDKTMPPIVRASAVREMASHPGIFTLKAIASLIQEENPLIRLAALGALQSTTPEARWRIASGLLKDPRLAIRTEAASLLYETPQEGIPPDQRSSFDVAIQEYVKIQEFHADRPESHLNLGNLQIQQRKFSQAESEYKAALKLQPSMIQGYVNLADLYRMMNRENEGEQVLQKALSIEPANPEVLHALGLWLVRQKRLPEALARFEKAMKTSADNPRYPYIYAIALNSSGEARKSITELETAHRRFPAYRDILVALVDFQRADGDRTAARKYAEELVRMFPDDPAATALLHELEKQ